MKNVAVWGSLNYGNFGDDVMNVIFGLHINQNNSNAKIYRLDKKLAEIYGLESCQTLDELLKDVEFCIIGGGSWLESRDLGRSYASDFEDLKIKLEQYNVKLYVVSIGGDAESSFDNLSEDRQELFKSKMFAGGTVRLKSDLKIFDGLNLDMRYYPDIVLSSSDFFLNDVISNESDKFKIGFSIGKNSYYGNKIVSYFERFPFLYRKYELYFLKSHLPNYDINYEYQYEGEATNIKNIKYLDLESFYSQLNNLDLMVCGKLHPGVASISCNVPFIWTGGLGKTKAFMNSVDLGKYEIELKNIVNYILTLRIQKKIRDYSFDTIKKHREKSLNHLNYLTELINNA